MCKIRTIESFPVCAKPKPYNTPKFTRNRFQQSPDLLDEHSDNLDVIFEVSAIVSDSV